MTPKEKAKELFEQFYWVYKKEKQSGDILDLTHFQAKQCAIIACDEIINNVMTGYLVNENSVSQFQLKMREYYQEVKQELLNSKQWNLK